MRARVKVKLICSTLHMFAYAALAIERQSIGYWILAAAALTGLTFALATAYGRRAR